MTSVDDKVYELASHSLSPVSIDYSNFTVAIVGLYELYRSVPNN